MAGSWTRALRCTTRSACHTCAILLRPLSILSGRIRRRHSACRRARRCSRAESRRRSAYSATSTALRARTPLSTRAACGCTASRAARRWPACSAPPARRRSSTRCARVATACASLGRSTPAASAARTWRATTTGMASMAALKEHGAPSAAPPRSIGRRRRCWPAAVAAEEQPDFVRDATAERCAPALRAAAGRRRRRRAGRHRGVGTAAAGRRSRSLAADARLLRPRLPARAVLHRRPPPRRRRSRAAALGPPLPPIESQHPYDAAMSVARGLPPAAD